VRGTPSALGQGMQTTHEIEAMNLRLALRAWRDVMYARGHRGLLANHMRALNLFEYAGAVKFSYTIEVR
jgi:hypothetical protein